MGLTRLMMSPIDISVSAAREFLPAGLDLTLPSIKERGDLELTPPRKSLSTMSCNHLVGYCQSY